MLEIHVIFPEKHDANIANNKVCEILQGLNAFVNNDIIVTPVNAESVKGRDVWVFDICFNDANVNRRIAITGGELLLTNGANNVWAFSKVNYDDNCKN